MLRCHQCQATTKVVDSRASNNDMIIRRRRECEGNCRSASGEPFRFSTYERSPKLEDEGINIHIQVSSREGKLAAKMISAPLEKLGDQQAEPENPEEGNNSGDS